eukprot:scaffold29199_cov62-Phaeocystis_antarctica.AAC.4
MTIDGMPTWCTPACPPLSSDVFADNSLPITLYRQQSWTIGTMWEQWLLFTYSPERHQRQRSR